MNFATRFATLTVSLFSAFSVFAQDQVMLNLNVDANTDQTIADAIDGLKNGQELSVSVDLGAGGENRVLVNKDVSDARWAITGDKTVNIFAGPQAQASNTQILFDCSQGPGRLATLTQNAILRMSGVLVQGCSSAEDGGMLHASGNSTYECYRTSYADMNAEGAGGVIAATDNARILCSESFSFRNSADRGGFLGLAGSASAHIQNSAFYDGVAPNGGCDFYSSSNSTEFFNSALWVDGSHSTSSCESANISVSASDLAMFKSTFFSSSPGVADYDDDSVFRPGGSFFAAPGAQQQLAAGRGTGGKPETVCVGSGTTNSLGYNLFEDDSCGANDSTDISNVDGMTAFDQFGFAVPQTGSPLIDSGATEAALVPGAALEVLPCGYKDILGLGRPQDANDDGVYECDRGAVEVAFPYALTPGHSAAFFNFLRNGEGQYVEMLSATSAIVYTFTHRPDGSGAAWFIGVGYVLGNSIVIDRLLRPSGTSFGSGFNSADIVNAFAGGQSMVFNDCLANSPGGNVAYSGNTALGYEALNTSAGRPEQYSGLWFHHTASECRPVGFVLPPGTQWRRHRCAVAAQWPGPW